MMNDNNFNIVIDNDNDNEKSFNIQPMQERYDFPSNNAKLPHTSSVESLQTIMNNLLIL